MRKNISRIAYILLSLTLIVALSMTAFAAGNVTYEGNARKFIFAPGSQYSPTDLFENFKNVMPGDSIDQLITVKNDVSNEVKIKIYMRVLGAHEGSEEFLSQLRLTVTQEEETVLFDAPADQTAQLTDWVCLGTFYSGAEVDLNVRLDVPIELSNEFQNAIGYLDWQFKVEELPIEPSDPSLPQTGDRGFYLYILLMVLSASAVVILVITKRKSRNITN